MNSSPEIGMNKEVNDFIDEIMIWRDESHKQFLDLANTHCNIINKSMNNLVKKVANLQTQLYKTTRERNDLIEKVRYMSNNIQSQPNNEGLQDLFLKVVDATENKEMCSEAPQSSEEEHDQEELDQDEREQDELFEIRTQPLDQGEPKQFNPKHDKLVIDESNQMETDEKAKSVLHKVLDQKPRKKFECKLCNRGYTQGGSLTRHIKNMHTNADKEGLKKSEKNPNESNTIEHKAPKGIKIERNDNEEEDVRENISENDQDSTLENVFKKNTNANSVVKISGGTLVKKIKEENSHQPNSTVRKIDIEKQYSAKIENQPKHEPIVNIKKEHWENTIQNSSAKKIGSIYQLQFFICPSCSFKNKDKQDLVNHICEAHPEVVDDLKEISDGSLR